jgi:ribosome-associated protein
MSKKSSIWRSGMPGRYPAPVSDDDRSAREISRGKRRRAGDRSAKIANTLMKLTPPKLAKVKLDDDLRESVDRARKITSHIARRRAERALAGELRRYDLAEIDEQLAKVEQGEATDVRAFHDAERWRARLIEEGTAALAELPGGGREDTPRLIEAARREKATGLPGGAARQLFRHVVELLTPPEPEEPDEDLDEDEPDDDEDEE